MPSIACLDPIKKWQYISSACFACMLHRHNFNVTITLSAFRSFGEA